MGQCLIMCTDRVLMWLCLKLCTDWVMNVAVFNTVYRLVTEGGFF